MNKGLKEWHQNTKRHASQVSTQSAHDIQALLINKQKPDGCTKLFDSLKQDPTYKKVLLEKRQMHKHSRPHG